MLPGRRAAPASLGRERIPTGTPTPGHAHFSAQLGRSLAEAGQAGGGRAEVFVVDGGCGSVEGKAFLIWPG